jgi:hypothetical protein
MALQVEQVADDSMGVPARQQVHVDDVAVLVDGSP